MTRTIRLATREKAVAGALLYLGFLFVSVIALGWLVIMGGNPLTITNIGPVNIAGATSIDFRRGEVAGIRRRMCSEMPVAVQFFPGLRDAHGFLYPLPGGMIEAKSGCRETTYGFIVPNLPAGEYAYVNTIRFQNNLVGRDETATFPPIMIRISP